MDKGIEAKIIERIVKDEALKKQIMGMDAKVAQAYLIKLGLSKVSEEEAGKLLERMKEFLADGALTDEELEKVAGGNEGEKAGKEDSCFGEVDKPNPNGSVPIAFSLL